MRRGWKRDRRRKRMQRSAPATSYFPFSFPTVPSSEYPAEPASMLQQLVQCVPLPRPGLRSNITHEGQPWSAGTAPIGS